MMEMQIRAWERQNLELAKQEWMPTPPLSILDLQGNSDIKKTLQIHFHSKRPHTITKLDNDMQSVLITSTN